MSDARANDLVRFYALLDKLERNIGGARRLADCSGRMHWPQRGVYFFRESGEDRSDTGGDPRIVRAFVKRLRKKLGDSADNPAYIVNERGVGYRMPHPGTPARP